MNPYTIYRTGDCAVTIDLGDEISEELNRKVLAMKAWLQTYHVDGIKDVITSYSALSIVYDFMNIRKLSGGNNFAYISGLLQKAYNESRINEEQKIIIKIPVCYEPEYGPDQQEICAAKSVSTEDLIHMHMSVDYRVYMVGFLPGFPYLGKVDAAIAIPRKPIPRARVEKGSVAIAGFQTGIYTLPSPGGWQVIGRTPFRLFEPDREEMISLQPGNYVRFFRISKDEFQELNQ
jgi:KipI family sensor histidine kinase inhibitor